MCEAMRALQKSMYVAKSRPICVFSACVYSCLWTSVVPLSLSLSQPTLRSVLLSLLHLTVEIAGGKTRRRLRTCVYVM